MILLTIVNGGYKPTNITGGSHIYRWEKSRNGDNKTDHLLVISKELTVIPFMDGL